MYLLYVTGPDARYIQHRERGSREGIPELEEIYLAVGHDQDHCRMTLGGLDVPSVTSQDAALSTLGKRPDARGRVVAG